MFTSGRTLIKTKKVRGLGVGGKPWRGGLWSLMKRFYNVLKAGVSLCSLRDGADPSES